MAGKKRVAQHGVVPLERITESILWLRGQKVMLVRIWQICMAWKRRHCYRPSSGIWPDFRRISHSS